MRTNREKGARRHANDNARGPIRSRPEAGRSATTPDDEAEDAPEPASEAGFNHGFFWSVLLFALACGALASLWVYQPSP